MLSPWPGAPTRRLAEQAGIGVWPVVRAEAVTYEQLEREHRARRLPALVGLAEVAGMLGVSKSRVCALAEEEKLPRPLVRLAAGPVWTEAGIERFMERRSRDRSASVASANAAMLESL